MFEKLIAKIGNALTKHSIPYMIIGGQAVLLYGEPRLTRDIDITLGINIDSLKELMEIVRELSLKPIPENVESFVRETMVLPTLEEATGIRVDFIFSFTPYESKAISRGKSIKIGGKEVVFISPEDLIIHKIFSGRPIDIEDAKTVVLKNPKIDKEYIRKWLTEFDETTEGGLFLDTFEKLLTSHQQ